MTVRILAVDDIESNLVALEALLQDPSISVVRARSGPEALRALLNDDFALILLDVQMPEMDGFDTASAIRERDRTSRIPIIFLTAFGASQEKVARAYSVGAADFLTKPLDPDVLRAKVAVIADLWRRGDDARREAVAETDRRLEIERQRWETEALRGRVVEQERATEAERAARLVAENANLLKDEFLATLSHELRTPLNAILGWALTLQRKGVSDPSIKRGLDAIERNANAQAKLIEDLLDTSRIVAGKVRLELRPVAIAGVIEAVTEALRPTAERNHLTMEVRLATALPAILGDFDRLQQIFTNVVSNALKFTPQGGRVEVSARMAGSSVELQVKDTGVGIPPQFLPQVFDRFRQGDGGSTRTYGGLGIGLSVARHLVALHGGTIQAESEGEGKGTTLTIVLPVRAVGAESLAPPDAPAPARQTPRLTDARVLVVDDEPDARDLLREIFEGTGAAVLAVDSADAAVDAFTAWKPDIIVSDIGMPGQDGYALMRRIRALPDPAAERVPAAALTAYATAEDIAQARQAGFQAHLAKPVDPANLLATVAALLGRTKL